MVARKKPNQAKMHFRLLWQIPLFLLFCSSWICCSTGDKQYTCDTADECPANQLCITLQASQVGSFRSPAGSKLCLQRCQTSTDCKSKQDQCVTMAFGKSGRVCIPCSSTEDPCDGTDNDCDGQVDNIQGTLKPATCPNGATCKQGKCEKTTQSECKPGNTQPCGSSDKGECKKGTQTCNDKGKWDACSGELKPSTEVCDGKDNDCNGKIDDIQELGKPCTDPSRKGLCQPGTWTCDSKSKVCKPTTQPTKEICGDGKDNDCNGQTDEKSAGCSCKPGEKQPCGASDVGECKKGIQTCTDQSSWGPCSGEVTSTAEVCDSKDNDCDGQTDEDLTNCTKKCSTDNDCSPAYPKCQGGQCIRFCKVHTDCDDSYWCQQGYCQTCPDGGNRSAKEVCDGKDNDCDGKVDVAFTEKDTSCKVPNKLGLCEVGTYTACTKGSLVCTGPSPTAESCDGKDQDCDGTPDNNYMEHGKTCTVPNQKGECAKGTYTACTSGQLSCMGPSPTKEICDGKDNDCNGVSDEGEFWAIQGGQKQEAQFSDMKVDKQGNIYITGIFVEQVNLGGLTLSHNCRNTQGRPIHNLYVAKIDRTGKGVWATATQCPTNQTIATSCYSGKLAIGTNGNLFMASGCSGEPTFGTIQLKRGSSSGSYRVFAKLDSKGNFLWAKQTTTSSVRGSHLILYDVTLDPSDNFYVTGMVKGIVTLGTFSLSTKDGRVDEMFVAKIDKNGTWQWAKTYAVGKGERITTDGKGNIIVGGYKSSYLILKKFDNTGKELWSFQPSSGQPRQATVKEVVTTSNGNIYLAGEIEVGSGSPVVFDKTSLKTNGSQIYVASFSNSGSLLSAQLVTQPSPSWAQNESATMGGLILDSKNNFYLLGGTSYNPGSSNMIVIGNTPIKAKRFLAKLDTKFQVQWLTSLPSSLTIGPSKTVLGVDGTGATYLGSQLKGLFQFGPLSLNRTGSFVDWFVTKLQPKGRWSCP